VITLKDVLDISDLALCLDTQWPWREPGKCSRPAVPLKSEPGKCSRPTVPLKTEPGKCSRPSIPLRVNLGNVLDLQYPWRVNLGNLLGLQYPWRQPGKCSRHAVTLKSEQPFDAFLVQLSTARFVIISGRWIHVGVFLCLFDPKQVERGFAIGPISRSHRV
jgi:hypothetical protein